MPRATAKPFAGAERILYAPPNRIDELIEGRPRSPDFLTEPFMIETNGGGGWESVPGFDARRARNIGLPDFTGDIGAPKLRPENTIGDDDRAPIADTTAIPWRSICRLDVRYADGRTALGTAWFVGPCALATAAHNLLHPKAGAAVEISAWPAYDGVVRYNAPAIEQLVYPSEWKRPFPPEHDYGVILLKDPRLGHQLGWFGTAGYDTPPAGLPAQVCGYSRDTSLPTQYYNGGRVSNWSDAFVHYTFDTEEGMSGSPVFTKIGDKRYVIAIHSYGDRAMNRGRRVSGAAFAMLKDASAYRRG